MIYDVVMATLGEAFIAVRADMSPFRRELKDGAQAAADQFEKDLGDAVEKGLKDGAERGGEEAGRTAGKKAGEGIGNELGDKKKQPWISIIGALGSALDDGISALPTELKAAIVIGILAAAPFVTAALAGAISAAAVAGSAALGVALATQFQSIQTRWATFSTNIRRTLVGSAVAFEGVLLNTFDVVEKFIKDLAPTLGNIFTKAAPLMEVILGGLLDGVGFFLDSLNAGLGNGMTFADALADALAAVGDMAGEALEILMSTGEDGADAFRDMVYVLGGMVLVLVETIALTAELYGYIRQVAQETPDWALLLMPALLLLKGFANEIDNVADKNTAYAHTNLNVLNVTRGIIVATKDEEKAIKELNKALDDMQNTMFRSIDLTIDFERALDQLGESVKENGKDLRFETEEGRRNLEALGKAIKIAQERSEERAASGKYTAQQLIDLYNQEIQKIYANAAALGLNRQRIDEVYGAVIALYNAPTPDTQWARDLAMYARAAQAALEMANRAAWSLPNRIGGNQPAFADGGIVYGPTNALIGEAGTEVVIPLTKPARAAQLMQQSGLDRMLGGDTAVNVQVFVGNEELDARTVRIVQESNSRQARALGFGTR